VHVNDNRLLSTNRDPAVVRLQDAAVLHQADLTQDVIRLPHDDREVPFDVVLAHALLHATIVGIVEVQFQVVRTLRLQEGEHHHRIVDAITVIPHLTRIEFIYLIFSFQN